MAAGVLRVVACGSVDDGKSTLIGRLLLDAEAVPADQLAALGPAPDLSRLVDGLADEREQGVTIDVAWRAFDLDGRRIILADCPGHEQYTRNMAVAASTADAAIVLVDARRGLQTQTRRHSRILAFMGVRRILLAVAKMELVGWSREAFEAIAEDYRAFARDLGLDDVTAAPVCALDGDNVVRRGSADWYGGPVVAAWLGAAPAAAADGPFRMPVQSIVRAGDFRGLAGRVVSGQAAAGDALRVLPSGLRAKVAGVLVAGARADRAAAGQSVVLSLADAVEVSRGDLLAAAADPPAVADHFEARLVWMSERPLLPGRTYEMRLGTAAVPARVTALRHRVDVDTGEGLAARTLALNDLGLVALAADVPVPFAPYDESRDLGGFLLVDRMTAETAGAGMIQAALGRSGAVRPQALAVDRRDRARLKGQKPLVLWFTGLSGAGKSTIADRVEQGLLAQGLHSILLDGDNVRRGLNRDLGFTDADRVENIRRVAEVARLMTDAGLIVLVSFISPFRAERAMARELMAEGEFLEIHVDAPLDVVEARDVKGLYRRAREGRLADFTGIDSPYEPPESPELRIDTTAFTPGEAAEQVLKLVRRAQGR